MALTASTLSSLVLAAHLAKYPAATSCVRENSTTGVPKHCPAVEFINALCTGLVNAALTLAIQDLGTGTLDVTGVAVPVPYSFPGQTAAVTQFLTESGWVGRDAANAVNSFVAAPLQYMTTISFLQMRPNLLMGTGTGVVSPASNPNLEAQAKAALSTSLPLAFQSCGFFAQDDIPGNPVNGILAPQLTIYAGALAKGLASITAAVAYVGTASVPTPVAGILNSGSLI